MALTGVVAVVLTLVASVCSYRNGAPTVKQLPMMPPPNKCSTGSFRPGHTAPIAQGSTKRVPIFPKSATHGYRLIVENPTVKYKHGTKIKVTLKSTNGRPFKGFFITGDGQDAKMGLKGTFEAAPVSTGKVKQVEYCVLGATHTDNTNKQAVTLFWNPPAGFSHGRIQFKATVVQDFQNFYTNIVSNHVVDPDASSFPHIEDCVWTRCSYLNSYASYSIIKFRADFISKRIEYDSEEFVPSEMNHMQSQFQQMMGGNGNNMLQNLMNQMTQGRGGRAGLPQLPGMGGAAGMPSFPGRQGK